MNLPFFTFYTEAWLKDTGALTLEEEGAYIRLLCHMWRQGQEKGLCSVPDDDAFIARLLAIPPRLWVKIKAILVDNPNHVYLHSDGGRLTQKRLQAEFEKAVSKRAVRSEAATARWGKSEDEPDDEEGGNTPESGCKPNANASRLHSKNTTEARNSACKTDAPSRDMFTCLHPDIRTSGHPEGFINPSGGGGGKASHAREASPQPPPPPSDSPSPALKPDEIPDPSDAWKTREDACLTDKLGRWAKRIGLEMTAEHAKAQLVLFRGGIGQIREGETVFNALCNFLLLEHRHQHRARSGTNGAKPEPDRDPPTRPGGAAYRYVA